MEVGNYPPSPIRFADFELDIRAGELRNSAGKIRLGENSLRVLVLLLERSGEVVTREELRQRLWPGDTFVDFEDGLNHAIRRLREALRDSADHPRFVETLPRHGYRFVAPVVERPLRSVFPPAEGGEQGKEPSDPPSAFGREGESVGPSDGHAATGAIPSPFLRRRRVLVLASLAVVALMAIPLGLNLAGLRDRILIMGTVSARQPALTPRIESIAVLPLENLSRDPEQEYFADGMTDELITNLAKVGSLGVISRTSVMQYKGTKKPLAEIARELNVDAVLEGTVRHSDDHIRITAQLVHSGTGRHLWAESYESELRDVLVLQREVARSIVSEVRMKLTPQEHVRLTPAPRVNLEAYEAFLKGRHYSNILTPEGQLRCIRYYEQAIQKDPNYALAYAQMAQCYDTLGFWEYPPARGNRQKALAAARKALQLDDRIAEALLVVADQKLYADWDWSGSEAKFRSAMEMDPRSVDAALHYGYCLEVLGRYDEAILVLDRARRLDPLSPPVNARLGSALHAAHQDERAIEHYRKMIEFDPNDAVAYGSLGSVYEGLTRYDEAIAAYLKGRSLAGDGVERVQALQQAYNAGGIRGYWRKVLEHESQRTKRERASPLTLASIFAHLGENGPAFEWLDKAYRQHATGLVSLKADRTWDPLRPDPRYQDLLRRMKLTE